MPDLLTPLWALSVTLHTWWALLWTRIKFYLLGDYRRRKAQIAALEKALLNAKSYSEYLVIVEQLDALTGHDAWREDPKSPDYDVEQIRRRLNQLRTARQSNNLWMLIFQLRTGLSRNTGGIGNPKLFAHSRVGTKKLIEEFWDEVELGLDYVFNADEAELSLQDKIRLCASLRKVFGRSALLLSGGATLGMYHLGVIRCLFEHKLLPRIFSGSSAGSLMAGLVCCKTDDELPIYLDPANINLNAIERPEEADAEHRMHRLLSTGYLFDIEVLQKCIRDNVGDVTFLEAYNKTRRVLNITVTSSTVFELPRLLNYLTAPNVLVWSAASASCAIPGVYRPVLLMAKTKTGEIVPWNPHSAPWVDGSVESDLPMARLAEQFNVNHFIVSQVNPHINPLLQLGIADERGWLAKVWFLINSEIQHRFYQLLEVNLLPNALRKASLWIRAIFAQEYTGDITIVPPIRLKDVACIMANPTVEDVREKILMAERACWKQLPIIRMHCRTERALDRMLYQLRVAFLERQGKQYRPLDFALGVPVVGEEDENDKGGRFQRSVSVISISSYEKRMKYLQGQHHNQVGS